MKNGPDTPPTGGLAAENSCLEDNLWTPILHDSLDRSDPLVKRLRKMDPDAFIADIRRDPFTLRLADVDGDLHRDVRKNRCLIFHTMGCSGDPVPGHAEPQDRVARAMAAQLKDNPVSFLLHLGDIAYKPDEPSNSPGDKPIPPDESVLFAEEFYAAYKRYSRPIFSIAGNHDGKYHESSSGRISRRRSPMWHFLTNFCSLRTTFPPDNADQFRRRIDPRRVSVGQPYPFFVLNTPLAYIIALYTNVANGGLLDDPNASDYPYGPQYRWLTARLKAIAAQNERREARSPAKARKAIVIAAHYPAYSGALNFALRGAPYLGNQATKYLNAEPLGVTLQRAFREAAQRPDLLISAHSHHYQRLTYRYFDNGWELPCLIVGCGGHTPIENLAVRCSDPAGRHPVHPLPAAREVLPSQLADDMGQDSLDLNARADGEDDFGFCTISVSPDEITGEFYLAGEPGRTRDRFRLDLNRHELT